MFERRPASIDCGAANCRAPVPGVRTRRRTMLACLLILLGATFGAPASADLLDDLTAAVANDRSGDVKALLARGMDPDSVDQSGEPMLCIAARNGYVTTAIVLLDAHAKPNLANRWGDTPLMLAALKGSLATVRALQSHGAKLNPDGWTPLIYAATGGHDDVVNFLIDHAANIDAESPNGTTALMMAVHEHHPATARLLIERGADVGHRNQSGATALSWAMLGNEMDLADLLRRAGATP